MSLHKQPNDLIHETSPYLLQHAYNPVKWQPFGDKAFEAAKKENKLVLVSVGYSACHWCHVMEHESFEDEQVAEVMNRHFVCIKVDREERADVDMLYMQAVQLMTGHGGWPMNCFVLPDGRPCYGGTYFNKPQWLQILNALADLYDKQPEKVQQYAEELTNGIVRSESFFETPLEEVSVSRNQLQLCVDRWRKRFDNSFGGPNHAPKFPLPSNYLFLLRYATLSGDTRVMDHVDLTLTRMAFGGINDQVHGGFARYSVDLLWKVPHFEKMLYDNSQLASLYIEAFTLTHNPLYEETAREILAFVEGEWLTPEGAFFSAYDADSEGEEGKYYVWSKPELEELLGEDMKVFSRYYQINETGYWEHGNYILMRHPEYAVSDASGSENENVPQVITRCRQKLRGAASQRVKPGLDDKVITSWNAMMCSAYARAYLAFGDHSYKEIALKSMTFLSGKMKDSEEHLLRTYKNGHAKIHGFLDDYAFMIEALINCYYISQDQSFLQKAQSLTGDALRLFDNPASSFLYYTSSRSQKLISRTTEVSDNVISSSNSQVAIALFTLGHLFGKEEWTDRSKKMLSAVSAELISHGPGYSNWGSLALMMAWPLREVAIVGKDVDEKLRGLYRSGATNAIFAVSESSSDLPLLRERLVPGKTMIYVCENQTCSLPVESVEEARKQLD